MGDTGGNQMAGMQGGQGMPGEGDGRRLVGAGFAFAISLGEFGATLFIARPDTPTVPIAIDRLLSQPGALNFAQAMAMSTILMVLSVASMLIIERWRTPGSQAF